MRIEVKPDHGHAQFVEEEHGESYIKDRVKSLSLAKNLSFLAILFFITQIVLTIIHLTIHKLDLVIALLTCAIVFLIGAGLVIYWAGQATKAYKANTELFQPRVNDRLTKTIFILALVFAATSVTLLVNLLVQKNYSPEYLTARDTYDIFGNEYPGRTAPGISNTLRIFFWVQVGFSVYYIIYFLVVARTAFKCLKFDNQAMSYLTFLGNTLLLGFGLAIIILSLHAEGYSTDPAIKALFPSWNIRGLLFTGICVSVISLLGFLVDHRSWRVGFFVLSVLLLIQIILLGNFTGFAYRHVGDTYKKFNGVADATAAWDRMALLNGQTLEQYGCPRKYLNWADSCTGTRVAIWEDTNTIVNPTPGPNTTPPTAGIGYYCLNAQCLGLVGQLYSRDFLYLANFGLLAILASTFILIACYYFWFVKWVDAARDKRKDYIWLFLMVAIIVAFAVVLTKFPLPYVPEQASRTLINKTA